MNEDRQYMDEEYVLNDGHSPARYALEGGCVFVMVFLAVRFGGWHAHLNPQEEIFHASTWTALAVATAVTAGLMLLRVRRLRG